MSADRKPKSWWTIGEFPDHGARSMTIMDDERTPTWTGLLDARGQKLFREPAPFGFRRGQS